MANNEWPWFWGWDDGSILYGPGNGKDDHRIQDHPELFAAMKKMCEDYFASHPKAKSSTKEKSDGR